MLFHHDPLHSDEFLDGLGATARAAWAELGGDPTELEMGMEGTELEVTSSAPVSPAHA